MIVGIGVDLIEVERIAIALARPRTGERFKSRVFTPAEIDYCDRRRRAAAQSYAARFAAKEAAMKALGKGLGDGVAWRDIEVRREGGAPFLVLSGRTRTLADELEIRRLHLSLTHTATLAVAYVIAEGGTISPPAGP